MERMIHFDPDKRDITVVSCDKVDDENIRKMLGGSYSVSEHTLLGQTYRIASDSAAILKGLSPSVMSPDGRVLLTGCVLILSRADKQLETDCRGLSSEDTSGIVNKCFWSAHAKGPYGDCIMVLRTEDQ